MCIRDSDIPSELFDGEIHVYAHLYSLVLSNWNARRSAHLYLSLDHTVRATVLIDDFYFDIMLLIRFIPRHRERHRHSQFVGVGKRIDREGLPSATEEIEFVVDGFGVIGQHDPFLSL